MKYFSNDVEFGVKFSAKFGSKFAADGAALAAKLATKRGRAETLAAEEGDCEIGDRHSRRLVEHVEAVLFGAGAGQFRRTKLLLTAILQRPAVRAVLELEAPETAKKLKACQAMISTARSMLAKMQTGRKHMGRRTVSNHLAFEAILQGLIPDDAKEQQLLRTIEGLLGINFRAAKRAIRHKRAAGGNYQPPPKRQRRSDYLARGRNLARLHWHSSTRLDTNSRKKKRAPRAWKERRGLDLGPGRHIEHWRHVQYGTNQQQFEDYEEGFMSRPVPLQQVFQQSRRETDRNSNG